MLEAGYRDLQMIKCEYEFSNTTVISLIESRLPKVIRREWAKEIRKLDPSVTHENKFEKLLDFLKQSRRVVEYDLSSVRCQEFGNPQVKPDVIQQ